MWFVDTPGERLYLNLLGYSHWFMFIGVSQLKDHSIPADQAIYATSVVAKYLDTATITENSKFRKTDLPYDIILTKADASTSD